MPTTITLTGASGFVGTALLRELLARDYRVNALVHSRDTDIADPRITTFRGDLDNPRLLDSALAGASVIIHLVGIIAEKPDRNVTFRRMHIDFTRHVVDAARRNDVRRYIHMSALGARPDAPSAYHQTKAAAEAIVEASSLDYTIFRPSLIHGPDGEFTQMMLDWARGKKAPYVAMPYFASGALGLGRLAQIQPILVNDVARLFVDALTRPNTINRRYDIAGEQRLTWPDMYTHFSRAVLGKPALTLGFPAWYATMLTRVLPAKFLPYNRAQIAMSQEDSTADLAPIQSDFDFTPTGFDPALATYADTLKTAVRK